MPSKRFQKRGYCMAEQNNNEIINDFDILNPFAIHSFLYFLFLYYRLQHKI